MSFTDALYNLMNKTETKYRCCTIEHGYKVWFWNGEPYLSLESAKGAIDAALLSLKNSIK